MNKSDFKYEDKERYLYNVYVYDNAEYLLVIDKDIFDDDTIKYVNEIVNKYITNKNEIMNFILNAGLREFYKLKNYTDEYIKKNIGKVQIVIDSKNDGTKSWKFKYSGTLEFIENKLDEHIILIDFIDDLNLNDKVQIDG